MENKKQCQLAQNQQRNNENGTEKDVRKKARLHYVEEILGISQTSASASEPFENNKEILLEQDIKLPELGLPELLILYENLKKIKLTKSQPSSTPDQSSQAINDLAFQSFFLNSFNLQFPQFSFPSPILPFMAPSPMPQFFAPTYFPQQPTLFPVMNDSARYAHQTPESCSPAAELPSVSVSKPSPPPTKPSKAARKRPAAEPIDIKGGSGKNQRDESPLKCLERMVPVNVVSPNIYSETDCGRFNLNQ